MKGLDVSKHSIWIWTTIPNCHKLSYMVIHVPKCGFMFLDDATMHKAMHKLPSSNPHPWISLMEWLVFFESMLNQLFSNQLPTLPCFRMFYRLVHLWYTDLRGSNPPILSCHIVIPRDIHRFIIIHEGWTISHEGYCGLMVINGYNG